MGEETMEFASRFTTAMNHLAGLVKDDTLAALRKAHGPDLAPLVGASLDAVQAVYETGTMAVRNWPEHQRRVLSRVKALRKALASGVTAEVRQGARELVLLVEPRAAELLDAPAKR